VKTARIAVVIGDRTLIVRLTPHQRDEVRRHAALSGSTVSDWVRETLDAARGARTHAMSASDASLDLATWVRVLILERALETDLRAQLERAYSPMG
jgi:uncharacterized membrane protein